MHAEHADKTELNGLSGRAFTVLNTLEVVRQYGAEVRYGDILIGAPGVECPPELRHRKDAHC
jgi:hypothetical protein